MKTEKPKAALKTSASYRDNKTGKLLIAKTSDEAESEKDIRNRLKNMTHHQVINRLKRYIDNKGDVSPYEAKYAFKLLSNYVKSFT